VGLVQLSEQRPPPVVRPSFVLTVYVDVTSNFVYRKKRRICKMKSKDYNIDKKILRQEKRYGTKRLLAEFTTVKRLQRKIDDTVERSTDNLQVEENEKLLLNKI